MKVVKGGVTTAMGFKANGLNCGIKPKKSDLALIYSENLATAAGVFTSNSVKAACVDVSKAHMKNKKLQAIVCNSGNANCFTGKFGQIYALMTAKLVGNLLGISGKDVAVASTGIIGKRLPFNKIEKSAPKLVKGLKKTNGEKAATAIMTTDTVKKECAVTCNIGGKKVTIGGCAKGAGMIEPNMATMLGFITTDASIKPALLKTALIEAIDPSFNSISVDGCMSTNDMVVVLANGQANNKTITTKSKDYKTFSNALNHVCLVLAKKIVTDGEGATKFVTINVNGAKTSADAKKIAKQIANSVLVKTATFGSNPNWGRVAQAAGSVGINVTEKNLKIKFSSFKKKNITITATLKLGSKSATVYTSDLSHQYIKINGEYT